MCLFQEGLVCGRAAKLEEILREAQTGQAPLPKSFHVDRREIFELVSSSKIENVVRMEIQIHLNLWRNIIRCWNKRFPASQEVFFHWSAANIANKSDCIFSQKLFSGEEKNHISFGGGLPQNTRQPAAGKLCGCGCCFILLPQNKGAHQMRHKSPSTESTKAQVCSKSSNLLDQKHPKHSNVKLESNKKHSNVKLKFNQKHSYVKLEILLIHILQVNETNHHYEVNLNQYQFSRK